MFIGFKGNPFVCATKLIALMMFDVLKRGIEPAIFTDPYLRK